MLVHLRLHSAPDYKYPVHLNLVVSIYNYFFSCSKAFDTKAQA